MKFYLHERETTGRRGQWIGLALTVGVHALVAVFCAFTGLTYLYPPPPETTFLIEFEQEETDPEKLQTRTGRQPQAEEIDPEKPVDLVQKAESPFEGKRPNTTTPSRPDPHGDVEVPTPEPKQELDPRAAFPGMSQQPSTSTTPHNASEGSDAFKEGEADGNTEKGKVAGSANAHVKGRNVVGTLPKPTYSSQEEGKVVVRVKIDQYGNVTEAQPGAEGTTVTDKGLWNAARKAALKAHFNTDASAPAVQEGTITYIFKVVA